MKILELFSGTRSITKVFEKHGWEGFTIDNNPRFRLETSMICDIFKVDAEMIREKFGTPDIIWASPPCTSFSVASISHHWRKVNGEFIPQSEAAKLSQELVKHTLKLIEDLNPKYFFIENPRGILRKMDFMQGLDRHTVTYCQYGDKRQKPTDIWTNHPNPHFKPMCKPGSPCHEKAPRGSRTGTQGLKGNMERSVVPEKLCEHIYHLSDPKANEEIEQTTIFDFIEEA